jgi:Protein of unknown function (DUF4031)
MPCYVDTLFVLESKDPQAYKVGARNGHQWCHLWADTDAELDAIASRIGLNIGWVQHSRRGLRHFDLTPSRRVLALRHGATEFSVHAWLRRRKDESG